ncbi:uncharacterized protein ASCRUDRAFT_115633 [Ascoidea rubescens DSM 1968]|uniref:Myb/SANT-like domain-containing protein n=1 Tax=Ascoidea rubescens DSM 1968 TaxID=1344418 RepID=A0A1D2VBH7_9ASCO|nr:hypothetical protein ASCRUDRAFT_115633 [Ascoidea rubescens DSM 1968]ODV59028.1 hypothetical protein ASCRUDRAFT_115633 [Ascoidea rubescens DSM 1968]
MAHTMNQLNQLTQLAHSQLGPVLLGQGLLSLASSLSGSSGISSTMGPVQEGSTSTQNVSIVKIVDNEKIWMKPRRDLFSNLIRKKLLLGIDNEGNGLLSKKSIRSSGYQEIANELNYRFNCKDFDKTKVQNFYADTKKHFRLYLKARSLPMSRIVDGNNDTLDESNMKWIWLPNLVWDELAIDYPRIRSLRNKDIWYLDNLSPILMSHKLQTSHRKRKSSISISSSTPNPSIVNSNPSGHQNINSVNNISNIDSAVSTIDINLHSSPIDSPLAKDRLNSKSKKQKTNTFTSLASINNTPPSNANNNNSDQNTRKSELEDLFKWHKSQKNDKQIQQIIERLNQLEENNFISDQILSYFLTEIKEDILLSLFKNKLKLSNKNLAAIARKIYQNQSS